MVKFKIDQRKFRMLLESMERSFGFILRSIAPRVEIVTHINFPIIKTLLWIRHNQENAGKRH